MSTRHSNSNSHSTSSQFLTLVLDRMAESRIIPAELARRLNCTDQNVALLLQPGRDYKLSTMERIAAAIGFQFTLSGLQDGGCQKAMRELKEVGRNRKPKEKGRTEPPEARILPL
jgi:hypothetical protein